ncbi:MAG TPA: Ig domain-containing protein, partial [Opitutaceae bacterium]
MKFSKITVSAVLAFASLQGFAQTNELSSISIGTAVTAGGTANGVAVLTQRIGTALNQPGSIGNNLAGLQYVAGQIPLDGAPSSIAFFTLTGTSIPGGAGTPANAFTSYGTLTSPTGVVTYPDVASKLTPSSYSALTFSSADLGFGSSDFYMIHHAPNNVDYWAEIVPGTGSSSSIADLKPMSWQGPVAGTPASPGTNGYFGLTWATGILSAGAPYADESMYYLRTDASSHTQFGVMIPALTGASTDTLDLTTAVGSFGVGGYTTLAFVPTTVVGNYPTNNFYYLRLDPITGNTVLGRLNPSLAVGTRTISDIANLGGVFDTLNFAFDATGPAGAWGTAQFYVTGSFAAGAQTVSFEAIPNHNVGDVFTITPTASSGLDIDVTVVSGPATVAQTGVSGATPTSLRIFTVTTTGPGIVTLQARQAGQSASPAFTANMLRQSFDVVGLPSITSANTAAGTVGTAFTYSITATGSPTSYAASPLPAGLTVNTSTGVISGTPTAAGVTIVTLTATNATGTSLPATLTITIAAAGVAPVITSSNVAAGTVGVAFAYGITATGSPTSYAASPLPAGLTVNTSTGVISGTPTAAG